MTKQLDIDLPFDLYPVLEISREMLRTFLTSDMALVGW